MTATQIANLILFALVATAAASCASAPARFYNLDSTATPDGVPAMRAAVMVGPVSVPAAVDRPEFVVQTAPNRVDVDEFNRWDARGVVYMIVMGRFLRLPKSENPA